MSKVESMRVGFLLSPDNWLGGRNYLRNLFAAIRTLPGTPLTPVIFTGRQQNGTSKHFPEIEIVTTSILDRKSPAWFARKILLKMTSQDLLMQRLLQQHHISALSHSSHLGKQTAIKTIGWIPDFQHVHLPEFFSPEERRHRDRAFMNLCVLCNKIIVSSKCAGEDLRTFAPAYAHKAELLQFVASPASLAHAVELPDLQRVYSFNGPYFLLPNQFWAHKNHRAVLDALKILKRQNEPFLVLATGSSEDYRNPTFFPSLMQYAAECDVLDCFRVLGQIPFDHLVCLMQHAIAFVNPSKFEGWSTSVEEAKSMGKQIVLSDIPVHREQAPERGFFFPADDPEALATAMKAAFDEFDSQKDAAMQDAASVHFPERQREFGEAYLQTVLRASGR
ncbi:MAG TPA: glycosyltransferase family 1 protein [Edaphobacter sp.]|nr:glycosyltransferase family 1 protein [Edaphobacter sp.]